MNRTTPNSQRIPWLLVLLMLLLTTTQYSPRLLAADKASEKRSLVIDCKHRYLSQRQASWLMATDNFSQTYARRAQVYAEVGRACAAGVAAVRVESTVPAVARSASARR